MREPAVHYAGHSATSEEAGTGAQIASTEAMTSKSPKVLVVFYSRSGTTRLLADAIARATQGDLEELRERHSRRGLIGWLRSGYDGTYRRSTTTLPLRHHPRDYDLVFIGSPTWNQSLSSPVRGFLSTYHTQLPEVALFATCRGRGAEAVIEQMAALLPKPPLARLSLLEGTVRNSPSSSIGDFTERALSALEQRAAPPSDGRVALQRPA